MDRLLNRAFVVGAAALALVACNSSGPTRFVGGTAVLAAVSSDQKYVAILANPTRLATGAHVGQLEAVPTSGQLPTLLDAAGAGAVYNRGNTLWYLGGVTTVDEGTPVSTHVYGSLYVWSPELVDPIKVGDNVRELYVSQNGATVVFMEWNDRTIATTNTGTLVAVTVASCGNGQCEKIGIGSDLPLAQTAWRISNDGKYVLATVRQAAATDPGRVVLLQPGTGAMHVLSTGVNPRSPMLQPTGETAAWVEGANEVHVVTTAMPKDPATVLAPTSPIVDSAAMVDAGDYIIKTREIAAGTPSLQRLSAAGTTALMLSGRPADFFVSQAVPGQTDKYVFYATTTSATNLDHDLWLLDMVTPGAQPVLLANAVDNSLATAVAFSDDGSMIEFFDNFDPVTRRGDEYLVPLAMPTRSLIALGVHNAAFIPGSTRLLYIAAPDATTGAGVLTLLRSPTAPAEVQDPGIVNFVDTRQGPARTWYTQQAGTHDDGVWFMQQP